MEHDILLIHEMYRIVCFSKWFRSAVYVHPYPGSVLDLAIGGRHRKFSYEYNENFLTFFFTEKECNTYMPSICLETSRLPHENNMILTRERLNIDGILKDIVIATKWH